MKFQFKGSKSFTILIVILVVGIILGLISAFENETFQWRNIASNLSSELIGAVVLYFILEKIINEGEAKSKEKNNLINRMDSSNNSVALDAIKLYIKKVGYKMVR